MIKEDIITYNERLVEDAIGNKNCYKKAKRASMIGEKLSLLQIEMVYYELYWNKRDPLVQMQTSEKSSETYKISKQTGMIA